MPLLAINLSDKLFLQVKELVEKGSYQSPESFLEIAAFNQLALERGATPAEIIDKGHRRYRQPDVNGTPSYAIKAEPKPSKKVEKEKPQPLSQPTVLEVADADLEAVMARVCLRQDVA